MCATLGRACLPGQQGKIRQAPRFRHCTVNLVVMAIPALPTVKQRAFDIDLEPSLADGTHVHSQMGDARPFDCPVTENTTSPQCNVPRQSCQFGEHPIGPLGREILAHAVGYPTCRL